MKDALLLVDLLNDFEHEDGERLLESFRARQEGMVRALGRARGSDVPVVYANDNHGAYLHQIAPGLRHAPFRFAWHLAPTRFTAQLPEELADLHCSRRRDGVTHAQ